MVHGAWHGAWCWVPVLPDIACAALSVRALDLPGCGARAGEDPARIGLAEHAAAISTALAKMPGATVVAHSYGGCVLSQCLADGAPIGRAVFLDALVLHEGECLADFAPAAAASNFLAATKAGGTVPVRPRSEWARLWGLNAAQAEYAALHLSPMPARCFTDRVVGDPKPHPAPRSYIRCAQNPNPMFLPHHDRARAAGFDFYDLDAPHSAMTTHPNTLATLLAQMR